ncbi:hypothetical protein A8L51_20305 [Pantoea stewartii]|uniref:Uncharacterized protein n=1 Tax=Pantoea stewartii TaxID=66269 RepID=A0AB34VI64_9GAMM|nr:hypothetical protein HA47_10900 [Pantoea stewartii subsp. indologenes]KTS70793.1 hypothetical protein RSA30_20845 [Pantoea stewartii]KTT00213.1 hypothetical protein RSA13_04460 [Pantoea stewartii]KTT06519.1 hypothetical protein RSA36_16410 [Pantoea stewartii]NRH23080.1 hypothetical protein [Pantoea stewartii]
MVISRTSGKRSPTLECDNINNDNGHFVCTKSHKSMKRLQTLSENLDYMQGMAQGSQYNSATGMLLL